MAFNIQSWGCVAATANANYAHLQDGTTVGSPGIYSYISAVDSQAVIATANYFAGVVTELDPGDSIYVVDSTNTVVSYYVLAVNKFLKTVTIGAEASVGGVIGPASSTVNAIPTFANTTGQLIQNSVGILDGSGNLSGVTLANVPDAWVDQAATPVTAAANAKYFPNKTSLVTLNMPAVMAEGSSVEIAGKGTGGWKLQMNTGQVANLSGSPTTSGGSLASANQFDCIRLLCSTANTVFVVTSSMGNIAVA